MELTSLMARNCRVSTRFVAGVTKGVIQQEDLEGCAQILMGPGFVYMPS